MVNTIPQTLDRLGLNQGDLARALDTTQASISRKISGLRPWKGEEIHSLLLFFREHDASITYEQLFGEPEPAAAAEPARAGAVT